MYDSFMKKYFSESFRESNCYSITSYISKLNIFFKLDQVFSGTFIFFPGQKNWFLPVLIKQKQNKGGAEVGGGCVCVRNWKVAFKKIYLFFSLFKIGYISFGG